MQEKIKSYIETHKDRFLEELFELLRIPSVSADSKYKGDVRKAAEFVRDRLTDAGLDKAQLFDTDGHPIVYAEKNLDSSKPTVLVYGHYDVQPADPLHLWTTPAFAPEVRDGKIYARGASDDKGQMYMHIKALELMLAEGTLPCNVKVVIEGEEEVGSPNLTPFVQQHKDMLKADVVLVSDTAILSNESPSITTGLRGLSYVEVEVTGPNRDLHSGIYGGAVDNPINALSRMIDSLVDEEGKITIPGFYDKVVDMPDSFRAEMAKAPFDLDNYKADLNIGDIRGENGYTTLERTSIRPSLDVNGIWGGYIGEGAKTVLPSKAYAKISMRLVPDQDSHEITELFTKHFESLAPASVKVKVTPHHGGEPYMMDTDSDAYRAAAKAMEQTFGKSPIPLPSGGSIPIIPMFEKELGIKSILFGFGLDSDAIHSPNEHFGLFNFYKGIETLPLFYNHYTSE